jgi:double-stranded uracil-DNA glycosylase
VPDIIAPGLHVLFCGINPGLYSGAVGHHFARPGNRFWRALHAAGFTERVLSAWEERELPKVGCGITDLVARSTAGAADLTAAELVAGAGLLEQKVLRYEPRWIAVVGIGAYRTAFGRPRTTVGAQAESFGQSRLWVLPNPSGLNANHQLPELTEAFAGLRHAAFDTALAGGAVPLP